MIIFHPESVFNVGTPSSGVHLFDHFLWSIFQSSITHYKLQFLQLYLGKDCFCAKRASKSIVPPKDMLLLLSIGTFLNNDDVISRKLKLSQYTPLYKNEQK